MKYLGRSMERDKATFEYYTTESSLRIPDTSSLMLEKAVMVLLQGTLLDLNRIVLEYRESRV
jgi:hypothetical protein